MKKWIGIILLVIVLIVIGLIIIFNQITKNPSILLNSEMADKVISTVIENIDTADIDVEVLKEAEVNKEVVGEALEEYGLSEVINIDNMTDEELELLRDKVVEYLESGASALPSDIVFPTSESN